MKAGILGGTGFTGRELIKILIRHPQIQEVKVFGRDPGKLLSEFIPELRGIYDQPVLSIETQKMIEEVEILFMALPHKVSMEWAPAFQKRLLLIDLSGDYRLNSAQSYKKWYGIPHCDPKSLGKYVYLASDL